MALDYTQFPDGLPFRYLNEGSDYSSKDYSKWNWTLVHNLINGIIDALGPHVIKGFRVSQNGSNVQIGTLTNGEEDNIAIIESSSLGGKIIVHTDTPQTIALSSISDGTNYIFAVLTSTSQNDMSWSAWADISQDGPPNSLLLAKIEVSGNTVTSVDHTVSPVPTMLRNIPWWHEDFQKTKDDTTSLQEYLLSLVARVEVLEGGGGGGGGGGTVYWNTLKKTVSDDTTIQEAIDNGDAATLQEALAADEIPLQIESENWDEDAVNQLDTVVRLVHLAPEFAGSADGLNDRYRTIILVPGIMGHLYEGDPNGIIDEAHSDMDIVDFDNHRFGV